MSTEPTDEQWEAIASFLFNAGAPMGASFREAPRMFDLIRDIVLEGAAKALEKEVADMPYGVVTSGMRFAVARLRMLKGGAPVG